VSTVFSPIRILALAASALAMAAMATPAGAATIKVQIKSDHSENDNNGCALREAIRSANEQTSIGGCTAGSNGLDVIRIPAGTYPLTIQGDGNAADTGDLDVSDELKIIGLGKGAVIDGGDAQGINDRIFDLRIGDVTMRNLTIQGGRTTNDGGVDDADGGGILTDADYETRLIDVQVLDNSANGPSKDGGGIFSPGRLTMIDSVVAGNSAPFFGGIRVTGGLDMRRTTVHDNGAAFGSGGLSIGSSPSLIRESTITGNRLEGETGQHQGAGLKTTVNVTVRNTTIAGNSAHQGGGGVAAFSGADIDMTNVTVTGNTADANEDSSQNPADGGGLYSENAGQFRLRNTVVSGNFDLTPQGEGDIDPDCAAQVTLAGNNLLGDESAGCAVQKLNGTPAELPEGTDPLFGPLRMNGGPTATVAFAKQSPLRNRIAPAQCTDGGISKVPNITLDQRSVPRPQARRCDVGAYEYATCAGVLVQQVGSGKADRIRGTGGRNGMLGLGGKDKLVGKGGTDGLCGGAGNDTIKGGPGKDKLIGGPGKDKLVGGPGKDICVGGPGKDVAIGCEVERGI